MEEAKEEIMRHINDLTPDGMVEYLDGFVEKWIVKCSTLSVNECIDRVFENFNIDESNFNFSNFNQLVNVELANIMYLQMKIEDSEEFDDAERMAQINKIKKLYTVINDARNSAGTLLCLKSSVTETDIDTSNSKFEVYRYSDINFLKLSDYEQLILFIIDKIKIYGYRRVLDDAGNCLCYRQVTTGAEQYNTHAWEYACTFKEFINEITRLDRNFVMWSKLNKCKGGGLSSLTQRFSECSDSEFRTLVKNRNMFSFTNGIYFTVSEETKGLKPGKLRDKFIPYSSPEYQVLNAGLVSSKFFDKEFEDCSTKDWFEVVKEHCPRFRSILTCQNFSEEVQQWMLVMIGRMFYPVGKYDDWQIMGFCLGMANTGKSSILDSVIGNLYDHNDIGILNNNGQTTFGLSALYDKLIYYGPEIKNNLSLDQAELQSMISGEYVSVNIKHKTARHVKFNVPGFIAGNQVPGYSDNAGSISRRFMIWYFAVRILEIDPTLKNTIAEEELVFLIQACNRAYLHMVNTHINQGIWQIVPQYFRDMRDELKANTNSLTKFLLEENTFDFGPEFYVPVNEFWERFRGFCDHTKLKFEKMTRDYYLEPFSTRSLVVGKKSERLEYPQGTRGVKTAVYLYGVRFKDLNAELEEE